MIEWLKNDVPSEDVVISTRIRLARNMEKLPFPHVIRGSNRGEQVVEAARKAFLKDGTDYTLLRMSELDGIARQRLIDEHVISPELAGYADGAAILSPDRSISVMLMEEDHYRIQYVTAGFDPKKAMSVGSELNKMLEQEADFAYSKELGYLTACPTNVGTGMRMSVMMHLPAITKMNATGSIYNTLSRMGFTVRGIYGEGSEALGDVYQVSNEVTLGLGEAEILEKLDVVASQVIKTERKFREHLYSTDTVGIEDMVMRSYGIMKYARSMSSSELLKHVSNVNMGIGLGIVKDLKHVDMYEAMIGLMPAMMAERGDNPKKRDEKRANIVRKMMEQ